MYKVESDIRPDTLGILELTAIARGYFICDAMLKKAPIQLLDARAVCPGKFIILIAGDVASVDESLTAGAALAEGCLAGKTFIPRLSSAIIGAINRESHPAAGEAVGIIESFTAADAVRAADAGVKAVDVRLLSVNLLNGLGGKAFCIFSGDINAVQAAVSAGETAMSVRSCAGTAVIPRAHEDLFKYL